MDPGAGWPCHEDQAFRQVAEILHLLRKAELLHGDYGRRYDPEHRRCPVVIAKCVRAKPGETVDRVGEVGIVRLPVLCLIALRHDAHQHRLERCAGERTKVFHSLQLAVHAKDGRLSRTQVQVGRVVVHQGLEQALDLHPRRRCCCSTLLGNGPASVPCDADARRRWRRRGRRRCGRWSSCR